MQFASLRRFGFTGAALLVLEITACSGSEETGPSSSTQGSTTSTATVGTTGATSGTTTTATATVGGTVTTSVTATGVTATSVTASSTASSTNGTTASTTGTTTATASVTSGTTSTSGAGGNTSASTTDATATSTGGGTSNLVLSDDFESVAAGSPPDAASWQLRLPAGGTNSIEVTSEEFHGGSQSVKVVGNSGSTMFYTETPFPLPNGVVYFRVWMRFTEDDWANHNAFVAAGPGEESQEVRFGGQANAYHANLAADGDGLSPNPFESPECPRCVAPVANEWKCLRGKLDFGNNAAELYVGEELAVDTAADGWHSGTGMFPANPTQIGFGWALYGALPNTVYYDDLAIGYEPIACE
ncbi:MAG TPA: hypothetical protein VFU02_21295 [Polyangiaceae bacterium]|nr:hypothetical protein [Polyangiaceae bacterium]